VWIDQTKEQQKITGKVKKESKKRILKASVIFCIKDSRPFSTVKVQVWK
jgi:hypothetical protein